MKALLLTGWNFMRVLRLAMGVILLISAVVHRDTLIAGFGVFFTLQGVFNFSTCGMGGCYGNSCGTPTNRRIQNSKEELNIEIVD